MSEVEVRIKELERRLALLKEAENIVREIVEVRKRVAREKGIWEKAVTVARVLGQTQHKSHGSYHIYGVSSTNNFSRECGGVKLSIVYDDYNGHVYVYSYCTEVFSGSSDVELYMPGDWEVLLDELYKYALIKEYEESIASMEKNLKEVCGRWGIDLGTVLEEAEKRLGSEGKNY